MAISLYDDIKEESSLNLTEEQQSAVDAPLPTVTLSCAGTGKTTTMIERIIKANGTDNIDLDRIFVATFSKYAAQDMTNRLILRLGDSPVFIGTFHRNCFKLFQKYPTLLRSHGFNPDKLNFAAAVDMETILYNELVKEEETIKKIGCTVNEVKKSFAKGINLLKNRGVYPIDYHGYKAPKVFPPEYTEEIFKRLEGTGDFLQKAFDENILQTKPLDIFWGMFTLYQQILKNSNQVDYSDVIALPVFAMRDEKIREIVSNQFDLVVIDEFQDCSIMQFELVSQLSKNYDTAFLVGDEDQLLYEWRNADLAKVMSFYEDSKFNLRLLEGNFRSQKPIIDLAVSVITKNKLRYTGKTMKPMREVEEPNDVYFLQPYDERFEGYFIAKQIKKILNNEAGLGEIPANEIAIIFSSKYYRNSIEYALRKENIDYNFVKGYGFYEYPEVKKVMSYLTLALDLNNDVAFKDVFNYPKRGNGSKRLNDLIDSAQSHKHSLFNELESNDKVLNYKENKKFVEVVKTLRRFMKDKKTPLEVIGYLEDCFDLHKELVKEYGDEEADDRITRLKQLELLLDDLLKEFDTYKEALEDLWLDIFSTPKENIEDKVQLMTAHASKGLEFKVVYIIGAYNGNFPSFKEGSTIESSRRIFYVATTRAKDLLTISSPRYIHRSGTVVECKPTMFLDGLSHLYKSIKLENSTEFKDYTSCNQLKTPSGKKYAEVEPEGFYD